MKYIVLLLGVVLVGCTTGSKTKTNINYYSNVSYIPEPEVRYVQVPVEVPVEVVKEKDRKSTRLNSSHVSESRMPSSA